VGCWGRSESGVNVGGGVVGSSAVWQVIVLRDEWIPVGILRMYSKFYSEVINFCSSQM